MSKVTFAYDIRKDAWSWVVVARDKNTFGSNWKHNNIHISEDLMPQIQKVGFLQAVNLIEEHLKADPNRKRKEKSIKEQLDNLEKAWKPVAKKYFDVLSNITNKPICTQEFGCFMTTGYMCPYKEKEYWFMTSVQHSVPSSVTTICHEIMHFQFLYYFKNDLIKKKLSGWQIEALKEALTFLLNEPEFSDVVSVKDVGYLEHKELRTKLKIIWEETKDFDSLVNEAASLM